MSIGQNDLCERYSKMETEELIELYQRGTLTEVARPLLESELRSRGVSTETAANIKIETQYKKDIGFQWWVVWAWLGLTLGNLYVLITLREIRELIGLAVIFIAVNSVLMIMVLKFNKYAFLIATILSLNPLLWIINGIYLKRRWKHPKINAQL